MAVSPRASELLLGYGPIVVMGVCGCGKPSTGGPLADFLGCSFLEGENVHPLAKVRKMGEGIPLEEADRLPWLNDLGARPRDEANIVVSCSASQRACRQRPRDTARRRVTFVFLQGSRDLTGARMAKRQGHYMPPSLLGSQLATLELPGAGESIITVDIDRSVDAIVSQA